MMLVLTRKPGEVIYIGDDTTITLLSVKGNQLQLGISAPDTVKVHRKAIYDKINSKTNKNEG